MLPRGSNYQDICAKFVWNIPERFNIASAVCDRHADGSHKLAIIDVQDGKRALQHSFDDLRSASSRLANSLRANNIQTGDRIGILLGQRVETLIAHLAIYKLGTIAVPLFSLFGPEALAFRLVDSGMSALITDLEGVAKITTIDQDLPALRLIISTEPGPDGTAHLGSLMERASDQFETVATRADDPALIIYTSGTTGPPKGALHAHRVLLGHLPGVQWPHAFFPKADDRFWTPADWAWIGGLFDVLMPSLYFGVPVVASRSTKFEAAAAIDLMIRHDIKNVFMPPTALRLLRQAGAEAEAARLDLRSLASGGEKLGDDVIDWGRSTFNLDINEFYGQTEANLLVGNNAEMMPLRSGCMGRPIPGHNVAVIDDAGEPCPPGESGEIATRRPDPVMFLGYWNNEAAAASKYRGDWLLSGDLGVADEDGYLTFLGRTDDVISSAGYRIGPSEIEDCLTQHPAIAMAAVIGVPDAIRGETIKACLVLREGCEPSNDLKTDIQTFVKTRLAAHEYPRLIEFFDHLPLTTTGKVMRKDLRSRHSKGD